MAAITTKHKNFNRLPPNPTGSYSSILYREFSDQEFGEEGDILEVCPLGRGMVIGGGSFVQLADLDSGSAHVFSVEIVDSSDTVKATLIDGSTTGQTGGIARPSKVPATEDGVGYVVPGEGYKLRLICDTAASTEVSGDILVAVEIGGARDNQLTE